MADTTALFGQSYQVLEKSLELRKQNHQYVVSNIANAQTPGYAANHLHFEAQLQEFLHDQGNLRATHEDHFGIGPDGLRGVDGTLATDESRNIGDENSVNMQEEMALLAENQIKFEAAARMLRGKFSLMQYVIQQGK